MRDHPIRTIVLTVLFATLAACETSPTEAANHQLLASVREATSRFAASAEAVTAGYQPDEHCVAHPQLGGMGQHWVKQSLVDPVFDPLQPEALLYAPTTDGGVRLVGVEYIVIDAGQQRPVFDDHPFDEGGVPPLMEAGVAHWSLHVWSHETNPVGTFAPFNPQVSCN